MKVLELGLTLIVAGENPWLLALGSWLPAPSSQLLAHSPQPLVTALGDISTDSVYFGFQLLMKENLDLKLTPYKVLATSGSHGWCSANNGFIIIIQSK